MALKNTTFRLSDEDRLDLDELAERTGLQPGDIKRRIVRLGIDGFKAELDGEGEGRAVSPALASLLAQQKKLSDMVERQIVQAEKVIEKQKAQADNVLGRLNSQQQRLSDLVEKQVAQAEKALERQRAQVEGFIHNVVGQQRKLSEQVREHLPSIFDRRHKEAHGEVVEDVTAGDAPTE